ncbi:MAG: Hsp20/alpha crystallin family protein [Planctomycetota bacterium]
MQMIRYTDPFRGFMRDLFNQSGELRADGWTPALDIAETKDAYQVTLELPGVDPQDVEISVEESILTITGEKTIENKEGDEEKKWYRLERRRGSFLRQIRLPNDVDAGNIAADSGNGLLVVTLPRREEAKAKKIDVRVRR